MRNKGSHCEMYFIRTGEEGPSENGVRSRSKNIRSLEMRDPDQELFDIYEWK